MPKGKFFTLKANLRPGKDIETALKIKGINEANAAKLVSQLYEYDKTKKTQNIEDAVLLQIYSQFGKIGEGQSEHRILKYLKDIIAEGRDFYYSAVLIDDGNIDTIKSFSDNPKFRSKGYGDGAGGGHSGFTKAIEFYNNPDTEVYMVFGSNMQFEEKEFPDAQMYVTATTSKDCQFESHMGIERTGLADASRREIASELHSFAAKVMMHVNPKITWMITTPTNNMRGMMQKWFEDKGLGHSFIIDCDPIELHPVQFDSIKGVIADCESGEPGWEKKYKTWAVDKAMAYVKTHKQGLKELFFYKGGCGPNKDSAELKLPNGEKILISKEDQEGLMKWYFGHHYHNVGGDYKVLIEIDKLAELSGDMRPPEFFVVEDSNVLPASLEQADIHLMGKE